jgi:hypothetical protein
MIEIAPLARMRERAWDGVGAILANEERHTCLRHPAPSP